MDLTAIHTMLEPAVEAQKVELYNIEYLTEHGRQVLRIYIDKEGNAESGGGITLDDCERVNYAVQPILDEHDPIPGSYVLEVSSPGLDRKLIKDSHYLANINKLVEVKLKKPLSAENNQKKFRGMLLGIEKEAIIIDAREGSDEVFDESSDDSKKAHELRLPREHLAYCRLIYTNPNF